MRVTKAIKKEQLRRLEETYKDEGTMLHYTSPFTLLVAVILSAQCTDKRVNIITARLKKWWRYLYLIWKKKYMIADYIKIKPKTFWVWLMNY